MIKLTEHSGYAGDSFSELSEDNCLILQNEFYSRYFERKKDKQLCYSIKHFDHNKYKIETSYMIGVDWVVKNKISIYVCPKLNTEEKEIDYLTMLFEALKEPENFNHLSDLYTIDFNAPQISITQKEDLLTPLLLLEYLCLMKQIVRKGLKKSYYKVTQNLNARVKGKILVSATVKQNHVRQKMTYNVC